MNHKTLFLTCVPSTARLLRSSWISSGESVLPPSLRDQQIALSLMKRH